MEERLRVLTWNERNGPTKIHVWDIQLLPRDSQKHLGNRRGFPRVLLGLGFCHLGTKEKAALRMQHLGTPGLLLV